MALPQVGPEQEVAAFEHVRGTAAGVVEETAVAAGAHIEIAGQAVGLSAGRVAEAGAGEDPEAIRPEPAQHMCSAKKAEGVEVAVVAVAEES